MSLSEALASLYYKAEARLAPGVRYSQWHYEAALAEVLEPGARWLDLGCGRQLLPYWRTEAERALVARGACVVGVDRDLPSLRHHASISLRTYGDIAELPFRDGSFTTATANMVVEHLDRPEVQFSEVWRVLAPGGAFLFHTPNLRGYPVRLARLVPEAAKSGLVRLLDGRLSGDVFPTHYRANTGWDIRRLAAAAGFQVEWIRFVSTSAIFARVLPLAAVELLWLRRLQREEDTERRSNILALLRKPLG